MTPPKVKKVNQGKHRLKKHKYKLWDFVAFKWIAEREIGFISEVKTNREGFAIYTVRSVTRIGCIYYDLEVDDPTDPYSYISSILTESITEGEKSLLQERLRNYQTRTRVIPQTQPDRLSDKDVAELGKSIQKQKDFINHKNFW